MKIKNILALLCFLCIGVSCSMEDDILSIAIWFDENF